MRPLLAVAAAFVIQPALAQTAPALSGYRLWRGDAVLQSHGVTVDQMIADFVGKHNLPGITMAIVQAPHFFDPVHARIFETAAERIRRNALATPVTLKAFLEDDPGLKELGGPAYLVRLAGAAISLFAARDYAQLVYDLAIRRELILIGQDIAQKAARVEVESEA